MLIIGRSGRVATLDGHKTVVWVDDVNSLQRLRKETIATPGEGVAALEKDLVDRDPSAHYLI